jgi:S1-C subfamily serine protease
MFKTLLTAALSVFLLTSANAADLTKLNNLVDRTNIMVNSGCSGTILDSVESLILTANHCIDQQYETVTREEIGSDGEVTEKEVRIAVPGVIHQFEFDGEGVIAKTISHRMEIVGRDAGTDLAVVRTMDRLSHVPPATIACKDPRRGEDVYIVGNPWGELYSSIVRGNVASLDRTYETIQLMDSVSGNRNNRLMQIAGGIVGGNSGGSVYNDNLELIGVPVLASPTQETVAFAVPREDIVKFLKQKLTSVPMKKAYQRIMGHCG